ncbi:DUF3037 domain-containing protein [Psychrobacter sp. UBA3962]|uniref:DUF3037 domain-containing protein n=1 Tax=Psychrobacter sp. UBA3962 TaxID=1947352 RepID=UPI0025F5A92C|nr:DUF3037 domain-containing protein [Psychrobacter sp. UBA3962]
MKTAWESLILESNSNSKELITGEWFTVRFIPDIVANEVFNIGVVFIDQDNQFHYKLIPNANAFRCLFGERGEANINFLLRVVDEFLKNNSYFLTPSPHIKYSNRQTAQGTSIEEILNDLFDSMVSLICKKNEDETETINSTMSTKDLRRTVFGLMKKKYPKFYNKALVDKPIKIRNPNTDKSMIVDMPIHYYHGINNIREEYYGTIVSAAYISDVHRIHNINYLGVTNVMNCLELLGKEIKAALIVYLPPVDDLKFTEQIRDQTERELDKCLYGLRQMEKEGYQLKLEVEDSTESCFHKAIEFIS